MNENLRDQYVKILKGILEDLENKHNLMNIGDRLFALSTDLIRSHNDDNQPMSVKRFM